MGFTIALFNVGDFKRKSRFSSLGIGYLAAYLRKYSGIRNIHIIEGNGWALLKKINPDMIGIFSVSQTFHEAGGIAEEIKRNNSAIPIIIGGYHITALPNSLPRCFDIGVLGEGEETLNELVRHYLQYGRFLKKELSKIKGIVFHDEGGAVVTAQRGFITELDSIPFPARDLMAANPFTNIITSRGCPYRCIFCASVKFWGNPRYHSAEYVVSEIEELIRTYKAVHISIWDDLFIANRKRLEAINELIQKKKINRKVSFGCAVRSNLVDDSLCALLKTMNVNRVSFGFESGSQRILDYLKCGSVTVEQHENAVKLCKKHGLYATGTFMLGSPNETREDLLRTLDLVKKMGLDGGGVFTLTAPLPGTELWDYAKARNLVSDDMDFRRVGLMSADFSKPDAYRGVLLADKIGKNELFDMAQKIQAAGNAYYLKGLLRKRIFSLRNLKFVIARPREAIAIMKFLLKSLLRKAPIMERYAYYYNKQT